MHLRLPDRVVDLDRLQVRSGDGTVALSEQEGGLLRYLADRAGQPVPREALSTEVLGYRPGLRSRALDNAVLRLRQKLGPTGTDVLQTVRGVGYQLAPEVVAATPVAVAAPIAPAGFFGRADELAALQAATAERLVVVHGPGGAGKTALVRAWLASVGAPHVWVDLAPIDTADSALRAVAGALGARVGPDGDPAEVVAQAVAALDGVLVLDDAEGVASVAAAALSWLSAVPVGRAVVVTSRAVFGLGERLVPVGPLAPQAARDLYMGRGASDDPALPALLDAVDRLPLAVEFVSAWARVASPAQLLERLDARFRILKTRGSARGRHTSMRAVLEASWQHLSTDLRRALGRLWGTVGTFELGRAERVLVADPFPLDTLARLADASWVHVEPGPRYRLLATVRAFLAEVADPADRAGGLGCLLAEVHDRSIAQHAVDPAERPVLELAAATLDPGARCRALFLLSHLAWRDGPPMSERLDAAVRALTDDVPANDGLRLRVAAAQWRQRSGDLPGAMDRLEDTIAHAQASGQVTTEANAARMLGYYAFLRGQAEAAVEWSSHAAALARRLDDPGLEAVAVRTLALQAVADGDYPSARALAGDGLELAESSGQASRVMDAFGTIAHVEACAGDHAAALRARMQALARSEGSPFVRHMFRFQDLVRYEDQGDDARLEVALDELQASDVVDSTGQAITAEVRGRLHLRRREIGLAEAAFREAHRGYRRQGLAPSALRAELELAVARGLRGDRGEARRTFARASAELPRRTGEITELGFVLLEALLLDDPDELARRLHWARTPADDAPRPMVVDRVIARTVEAFVAGRPARVEH